MSVSRSGELYYTEEEKEAALNNNNALQYALSRGYHLVRSGNEFHLKEHDSMVFKADGRWYWNSQSLKGRALDFIQHYENREYKEAICILAGTINQSAPIGPVKHVEIPDVEKKEMILPERAAKYNSLFFYLCNFRGIDELLVKQMVAERKVYQAITYNKIVIAGYDKDGRARYKVKEKFKDELLNIPSETTSLSIDGKSDSPIFQEKCLTIDSIQQLIKKKKIFKFNVVCMVGYDENGKAKYASIRSMNTKEGSKSLKVDVEGSDKSYPFQIDGSPDSNTVCVLESPIEGMSYWSMCHETKSDRQDCYMIGLGGASVLQALDRFLKDHPQIDTIVSGLNNDDEQSGHKINAGLNGTNRIIEKYSKLYTVNVHKPHLNDWNNVLTNYRKHLRSKMALHQRNNPLHQKRPNRTDALTI
ncbi:toprim domain-containing protein [Faecalispora jeddahensis]|uniref:toprim domain-containing protein n=1 Tax=Faecalispora jeddahensis TaxID=1414721 RepID=UPI0006948FAD|nr:toprim domain-containing protein [Faecalispora jeddahensis]